MIQYQRNKHYILWLGTYQLCWLHFTRVHVTTTAFVIRYVITTISVTTTFPKRTRPLHVHSLMAVLTRTPRSVVSFLIVQTVYSNVNPQCFCHINELRSSRLRVRRNEETRSCLSVTNGRQSVIAINLPYTTGSGGLYDVYR